MDVSRIVGYPWILDVSLLSGRIIAGGPWENLLGLAPGPQEELQKKVQEERDRVAWTLWGSGDRGDLGPCSKEDISGI